MSEYVDNGARLGWLIDPEALQVHCYCPGEPVRILARPQTLSGEDVLPGFTLDLQTI